IVGDLSAGERQRVEIIRCLLQDPSLLIMDEPTSVLTPQEVEILFHTLRQLREEGTSILYISHKLEEIRALCEHATILRLGEVVATCDPRETLAREMAEMMVGSALHVPNRDASAPGATVLELKSLSAPAPSTFATALNNINLTVRRGEILGIGGVAGNGQEELLLALSGEMKLPPEMVSFEGAPIGNLGPDERRALGLLAAPEERMGHASAPDMSLIENATLTARVRGGLAPGGFINWGKSRSFAEAVIERFDVRTPSAANTARSLSGGNLQKFVIGREIMQDPDVLVVSQPTWGVDAAAAAAIRQALLDLASGGAAVIVVSQDLDEILEISDKFAALNEGALTQPVPTGGLTVEKIGLMLGGAQTEEADQ
ncbi:MAG: ATP-binding cassette domain-containing protein, partial [Rhodobacteraceae bacterium]|nr:ATP-binding cassette domain-containing protein [Paracoccaceae bacterium]